MPRESIRDRLLVGIEIGGTKLQIGVGRGDGKLVGLDRLKVNPAKGAEGIRAQIVEATKALFDRLDTDLGKIGAVGIGFGGPVDASNGVVTLSNQIDGWSGFPLAEWASRHLGVARVVLQNDADTAALGEARFGAGVGASPVLYVTVGSGIGGGLVIDGSIYRGSGHGAVEIGHLIVDDRDSPRTLESIASGWSIGRDAAALVTDALRSGHAIDESPLLRHCRSDPALANAAFVALAAEEGDRLALGLLDTAARAMAIALAHAVTLLAPRRIILGGGVSLMSERLWHHPIRAGVDARVFPPFRGTYDIVPPLLGEEVVVHGALALALDASRLP